MGWLQVILIVADVTPIVGSVAATVAFGAVAACITVIQGERMFPGRNTRAPFVGGRVTFGAVFVAKVMGSLVAIATDVLEAPELGPVVTIKALQSDVCVD